MSGGRGVRLGAADPGTSGRRRRRSFPGTLDGHAVTNPLYTVSLDDVKNDSIFVAGSTYDTVFYCTYISETYRPGDSGMVNAGILDVHACKTQP